ncbi:YdcF family protein [Roseiconus nitratireducens]|uniref:YdcF family protein n=1 Tax=Roseiconus nitratireducens TaxID=2605748 RepID=A0A5M6DFG5_9BACT|nr:ElyC/SanA/YdcF family protein [Roseiconus nitratireducens]KAA5546297.1 YdcF family protein [Roseiconus nitratireducens]
MKDPAIKWRRRFWAVLAAWLVVTVATSFEPVRGWLIRPLYVHDEDAKGEIAYVMADGPAYWERLHAASDLYHMHRIGEIYVLHEDRASGYDFERHQTSMRIERVIDFLGLYDVPKEKIHSVPIRPDDKLSSLSEAVSLSELPRKFSSIVVVTSPPHTRRSLMCFRRTFGDEVKITVYSAALPGHSDETFFPIWIEYVKLVVYWFAT